MFNISILVGYLGRDPEIRYTKAGEAVANFSMATSKKWKDRNTNERKEATEWHNVEAWGGVAEVIGEYSRQGSLVLVVGESITQKWQDRDGNDRYTHKVRVNHFQLIPTGQNNDHSDEPYDEPYDGGYVPNQRQKQGDQRPKNANSGRNTQESNGYRDRKEGKTPPQTRQEPPARTSGTSFDDMDDDIPF